MTADEVRKALLASAEAHLMMLEVMAPDLTDTVSVAYWQNRIEWWRKQTKELAQEVYG